MSARRRPGALLLVSVLAALLVLPFPRKSDATALSGGEIRFEGVKRTHPRHMRLLLDRCLEEQGAVVSESIDLPLLDQCLLNSELFSEVSSRIDGTLTVAVRERWTLIPLPFFRSQEDSTSAGAFLMESNFLGRGQLLVLGATFGSRGNSYFGMLRDPSVAFTDWTSRLMYVQGVEDVFRYDGTTKADGYRRDETTFSLSPGYRFSADFEARAVFGYTRRSHETAEPFGTLPEDYRFWAAGFEVELDATDFKFYFSEGHRVEAGIRHQFARSGQGDPTFSWEIEGDWQFPLHRRGILKLAFDAMGVGSDADVDSLQVGGTRSLRGVQDQGLWARHLAGIVLDYHLPVREGSFGTWAAGPFLSYALYRPPQGGDPDGWEDTFAYGAGLFFYLKKVAFPGIGIVAGRNEGFSGSFVTVQIGFSR